MASRFGTAIAVSSGLAVCALSAAVAFANIPDQAVDDGATVQFAPYAEEAILPLPAGGVPLFVADASASAPLCVRDTDVIRHLEAERDRFGGETVMLAEGLDQAFADEWRRQIDGERVTVSAVLAHVFGDDDAAVVDVVELGADGCALSRTLLTGDDWRFLLGRAAGVEA